MKSRAIFLIIGVVFGVCGLAKILTGVSANHEVEMAAINLILARLEEL